MKTSLFIPLEYVLGDTAKAAEGFKAIAQAAEANGLDGCNVTDHPAPTAKWRHSGGHEAFDPFAALSYLAAVTSRIRLLTHIVVLAYRNPFITAKCLATLDVLSGGRATMGIGAGYLKGEYAAVGVDFATRGAAMDEAIEVMKLAWSGEPVAYAGSTFSARETLPEPLPLQKPHPPIWGGGNSKRAIRRAATLCQGWSPFFVAPEQAKFNATEALVTLDDLRSKIAYCLEQREAAGLSGPFDIAVGAPSSPRSCDAAARQYYLDTYGEMARSGVTWTVVNLPGRDLAEYLDSIAWFGAEVQPHLGAMAPT